MRGILFIACLITSLIVGIQCDETCSFHQDYSCVPEATCDDLDPSLDPAWMCVCPPGSVGDGRLGPVHTGCIFELTPCDGDDICHLNGECSVNSSCICRDGYHGDGKNECTDINECDLDICDPEAICQNFPGGFSCTCPIGFAGDGRVCRRTCIMDQDCDFDGACVDEVCVCKAGYEGNGYNKCDDVDECLTGDSDCGVNADCINEVGSFLCQCSNGYDGDGYECKKLPRNCQDVRDANSGYLRSGLYLIDPDEERPVEAFKVECKFKGPLGITIFESKTRKKAIIKEEDTDVFDPEDVPKIRAVVESSQFCYQFVSFFCDLSVNLLDGTTYWEDAFGNKHYTWSGSSTEGKCGCGEIGMCEYNASRACMCDGSEKTEYDRGKIIDMDALPITRFHFEQLGMKSVFYIEDLFCSRENINIGPDCDTIGRKAYFYRSYPGTNFIDPDGPSGPQAPRLVHCDDHSLGWITVIPNDKREPWEPSSPGNVPFIYITPGVVTDALIDISQYCSQEVIYECRNSKLLGAYTKLVTSSGEVLDYWAGGEGESDQCACGLIGTCDLPDVSCNCNIDDGQLRVDLGLIRDKAVLPIGSVDVAQAGGGAYAKFTVGPLKCGSHEFDIAASCESYRGTGYDKTYTYLVDPDGPRDPSIVGQDNQDAFYVVCEMISLPPQAITIIHHHSETTQYLSSSAFIKLFMYRRVVVDQLKEYIKRASYCVQAVGYGCSQAPLNGDNGERGFWENGDGTRKYYFSGVAGDTCACGLLGDCDGGEEKCNCDVSDNQLRRDDGVLGNKDDLPVTRVEVPGVVGYAELDVGPLRCFETYPSCEDLGAKNRDVELEEGAYTIDPDGYGGVEAFAVLCDFPKTSVPVVTSGGPFGNSRPNEPITECFNISYGTPENPLSPAQVQALVDSAAYCEQKTRIFCRYFPLSQRVSYTTCGGETFNTWTGIEGEETCECGVLGICEGGGECNCDLNERQGHFDAADLFTNLPICQVCITADPLPDDGSISFRQAVVTVKDLECSPPFGKGKYTSCQNYVDSMTKTKTDVQRIDPDGPGPIPASPFYCVVPTYPPAGIMYVLPREPEIIVPEEGIDITVLYYIVMSEYLEPIIKGSEYCEQELFIECGGAATLDLTYYGFAGPGGNIETYWAGNSDPDSGGCEGGVCRCGDQSLSERIDGGVVVDQDALPITRIKLGPSEGTRVIKVGPLRCFNIKPDCQAYLDTSPYIQRIRGEGEYAIDPDGAGGVSYYMAHCDFDSYTDTAVTEIFLLNRIRVTIRGSVLPNFETVPVEYEGATPEQVNALTRISGFCYQGIEYECKESAISNATYLELVDGQSSGFGTADNSGVDGCACVITDTCPEGKRCHCDSKGPMTRDYGIVTDRERLPVTNVQLTGQDSPSAQATVSVTGVRCALRPIDLPIDCEDAYVQEYRTGEVYIQPNPDVEPFFVYCDMEIVPGHGITIIGNKFSDSPENVTFPDVIRVQYNNATTEQVNSLASVSVFCYQPIKYNCYASKLMSGNKFYWIGRDGVAKQRFFGAGNPNDRNCNCGVDKMCGGSDGRYRQTNRRCNCDSNDQVWRLDAGVFSSDDLPINVLRFSASKAYSEGSIQLGELYCGHVEFDLNECEIGYNDCAPEALCRNTVGSYECRCPRGYRGWGLSQREFYPSGRVCYDDNECKFNYCPWSSDCTNTPGSFTCDCHAGFEQVGATMCKDIDECANGDHDCDVNAYCTNIPGSFFCKCNRGYRGSGKRGQCEEVGYCACFGDPHCVSFDSRWLNFQGDCSYVMARDNCQSGLYPTWQVSTQNWRGRIPGTTTVSWVKSVRIEYNNHVLDLRQGLVMLLDGVKILPAYWDNGFIIRIIGSNVEVYLTNGVLIQWNGKTSVEIHSPRHFKSDLCGLCGNYNDDPADDWVIGPECPSEGDQTDNNNLLGESWSVPGSVNGDTNRVCEADCDVTPGEGDCTRINIVKARRFCGIIFNAYGSFKACIAVMPGGATANFYESCVYDLCHMDTDMSFGLCSIAEAFVKVCQTQYKVALPSWRSNHQCREECGENMVYRVCGNRNNEAICRDMLGTDNPFPDEECSEGCFCKEGFMVDGDRCVEPEGCGCIYEGKYMSIGDTVVNEDCTKITECTAEVLVESVLDCGDQTCRMVDGVRGCFCDDGFMEVDNQCSPDPCYGNQCAADSVCVDGECVCEMGFTGECDDCNDDDECRMATDNCHEKAFCVNTRGSYFCLCDDGFLAVDGKCNDMDECTLDQHSCGSNTKCINTYGGYECVCCEGYTMQLDGNCTESADITGENTAKCCVCTGDTCDNVGEACGKDANTYPSEKDLIVDACERGIPNKLDYRGQCKESCSEVECPAFKECTTSVVTGLPTCDCEPCSSIDTEPQVVCLNPIDKFESMCEFKEAMCLTESESPPVTGDACDPPPGEGPVAPWNEWSPCSVSCGKGRRERSRQFTGDGSRQENQVEDCYEDPCPDGPCAIDICTGYGEECVAFDDGSTVCECPECAQPATEERVCGLLGNGVGTFLNSCKLQRAACLKNLPFDELNPGSCGELPKICSRWPNFQYVREGQCFSQRKINFGGCIGGCSQMTGECCGPKQVVSVDVPLACTDGSSSTKTIEIIKSCECTEE